MSQNIKQESKESAELKAMICRCTTGGGREGDEIGSWDGCALEGQAHTSFILYQCSECGRVFAFPTDNLDLAMENGTPATKTKLREIFADAIEDRRRKILDAVFKPL